ncbi:unnamed protein product [Mycena citricolor]|uniref:HpcH/HpaI aldolase/citrate lyase domain-containing protein n=1 Tax=Mycena citricolor TaxID=2018698 RepID=A0AAD2K1W2_9AGAR|nr:unnamed protein product [Mycena citricolor]
MPHALLRALRAKTPAFGLWLTAPGFLHTRTAVHAAPRGVLSWVALDCEHGVVPGSGAQLAESIAAVHLDDGSGGVRPSAVVRVAALGSDARQGGVGWQVKHALDVGARGVIVPMVSTADEAHAIARCARYPPRGRRGFGSPYTHLMWGQPSAADYLAGADGAVLVMAQIETREGAQNVRDIARVDGIDVLFVGPYDLSMALGFPPPNPDPHPEVEKVIQQILATSRREGKKCAIYCTNGAQAAQRAKEGFDMINVLNDVRALSSAIEQELLVASGSKSGGTI